MKLELSLFRFDHKSDYLPYYTKHYIKINEEKNLLDIFNTINEDQALGYEKSEEFVVAINGIYTPCSISIEELKSNFGKELTIEPMSIRRSHSDLLINEDDFNDKFEILSSFASLDMLTSYVDKEIVDKYHSYKIYFYASNTLNYQKNYIGDAILLLACDLIDKYPKEEINILKALNNCDYGAEFHTNLSNRIYNFDSTIEDKIQNLKTKLNLSSSVQNFRINNTYIMEFDEFQGSTDIKHNFKDFNLAYYEGIKGCSQTKTLLNNLEAKIIPLENGNIDLAMDTFHINPELTFQLVSTVMLEAFDQNANLLIVDSEELFYLFDYNRKELKKVSGRDIEIPILHKSELEKLALGQHGSVKDTLNKHSVNPDII